MRAVNLRENTMKKMMILAVAVVGALSFGQAANAADDLFGSAFGSNTGSVDSGLNVLRANINKSDLGVTSIGASVGNSGDLAGDKFNAAFLADGRNAGPVSATGNLTDSTLNGGGSLAATANGNAGGFGLSLGGQLTLVAEDKSSFNVKGAGVAVNNEFKVNNPK